MFSVSGECCFCGEIMIRDIDTPFIDDEDFDRVINDWLWNSNVLKWLCLEIVCSFFWPGCIGLEQNKNSCGYMFNKRFVRSFTYRRKPFFRLQDLRSRGSKRMLRRCFFLVCPANLKTLDKRLLKLNLTWFSSVISFA